MELTGPVAVPHVAGEGVARTVGVPQFMGYESNAGVQWIPVYRGRIAPVTFTSVGTGDHTASRRGVLIPLAEHLADVVNTGETIIDVAGSVACQGAGVVFVDRVALRRRR